MRAEHFTVIFGMLFLAVASLRMILGILRGRSLCEQFARRLPAEYAHHNEPRPAFFYTARSASYSEFVLQRKFLALPDPALVKQFELRRREEIQNFMFMAGGFAILGLAWLWIEVLGSG